MRVNKQEEKAWEEKFCNEVAIKYSIVAYKFKLEGVAGGYDRFLLSARGIAFLECKRKDGTQSGHQIEFERLLNWAQIPNKIAYSYSEALTWVRGLVAKDVL